MIKILFLINTLGGGGAERVLVNLVNHMDYDKFDITVETMFGGGNNRLSLTEKVHYICKGNLTVPGLSRLMKFFSAKSLYRHYIGNEKYDIIVAYMHGIPTKVIIGCKDPDTKKVTWLHHGNPMSGSFFKCWMNEKEAISAYNGLDAIVGVSEATVQAFSEYTGITDKCLTLYNTNDIERIKSISKENVDMPYCRPILCTVGNLSVHKGYDRLIRVVERLREKPFTLLIIGEGREREQLTKLIRGYRLEDKIKLLGFQSNPYQYMIRSDLFVSSSREEGLATVLVEALAVGLPVISTDVSGAREVLGSNNEYGMVVDNTEEGIYQGLSAYLESPGSFDRFRKTAKERAEFFNVENTVRRTEAFFESLVCNG